MPRSPEEKKHRAEKYGRRHRLLHAQHSEADLAVEVKRLLAELRASSIPPERVRALLDDLKRYRDIRRRHGAIWAIVDALEAHDAQARRAQTGNEPHR